jgi:hypothetical protein
MMKKIAFAAMVVTICLGCEEANLEDGKKSTDCTIPATIVDLGALDGCGYVFELENGERLEPWIILECYGPNGGGDPGPLDPLIDYEFVAGKKVLIEYKVIQNAVSTCQAGTVVKITCLTEGPASSGEH